MRKRSGREYRDGDLEFLKVVAGRVALALDNAGLSQDVRELENQLRIALGDLSDAVTVTDAEGADGVRQRGQRFEPPWLRDGTRAVLRRA